MKEYNVSFEITQLANSPVEAAMLVDGTLKEKSIKWCYSVQELNTTKVLNIDLESEENEQELDITENYLPQIIGSNLFTIQQMLNFAHNFYYDLSRKNNVPENLISENFTLVEEYFKETFNK